MVPDLDGVDLTAQVYFSISSRCKIVSMSSGVQVLLDALGLLPCNCLLYRDGHVCDVVNSTVAALFPMLDWLRPEAQVQL